MARSSSNRRADEIERKRNESSRRKHARPPYCVRPRQGGQSALWKMLSYGRVAGQLSRITGRANANRLHRPLDHVCEYMSCFFRQRNPSRLHTSSTCDDYSPEFPSISKDIREVMSRSLFQGVTDSLNFAIMRQHSLNNTLTAYMKFAEYDITSIWVFVASDLVSVLSFLWNVYYGEAFMKKKLR